MTENQDNSNTRGQWSGRLGFVLAAAGSAVGLGNIWSFPYITGENGGGAFVLVYLICIVLVGLPIMIAEIIIGRWAQKSPVGAIETVSGKGSKWRIVGFMGVIAGFLILSFYSVVAGWTLNYFTMSMTHFFADKPLGTAKIDESLLGHPQAGKALCQQMQANGHPIAPDSAIEVKEPGVKWLVKDHKAKKQYLLIKAGTSFDLYLDTTPEQIQQKFTLLVSSPGIQIFWHLLFMVLTIGIVYGGVKEGIENWSNILMPLLFLMLIALVLYSLVFLPQGFKKALQFTFIPESKLLPSSVLTALGQAFFSLSLGMGAMLTYGSYLAKDADIPKASASVCVMDTMIAFLACMVIFPIIFAFNGQPSEGEGLVFKTMPVLFSEIPGGLLVSMLFFLLLGFAALTSAVSLLEVVASYFIDQLHWSRKKATLLTGSAIFIFGIPSTGALFSDWQTLYGKSFFETVFELTFNWMLPIGGLCLAIFVGWFMNADERKKEFVSGTDMNWVYPIWLWILRFVVPLLVMLVLLNKIGLLETAALNRFFWSAMRFIL